MNSSVFLQRVALATFCVVMGAEALAGDSTALKRTILERNDQTSVAGKEVVLGTAELPAGGTSGWHTHPGDESGYVLSGELVLKVSGEPDRNLKGGDHFFNPAGVPHELSAALGSSGGVALSTWIVDKGVPMASPVH